MKKLNIIVPITLILILNFIFKMNAQTNSLHSNDERVILITDRSLYITGENILFSIDLLNSNQLISSDIVYIELITPNEESLLNKKFKLINYKYSGEITLPKDILTGYYYLKAYTKIMRNIGPSIYNYTAIKIINPYKSEILNYTSSDIGNKPNQEIINPYFQITTNKSIFSNREKVITTISSISKDDELKNISVSVIPESSFFKWKIPFQHENIIFSNKTSNPEISEISIKGRLIDEKSGSALPNTSINLSINGPKNDSLTTNSDSLGYFAFNLPEQFKFLCNTKNGNLKSIDIDVKSESYYFRWNSINSTIKEPLSSEQFNIEDNGISITGKIIDETNGSFIANTAVNLSIIGKDKDFMATVTDSSGFFYFILPNLAGQNDIFLSCLKKPDTSPKILVFNDFCTKKINIATPPFELSKEERNIAYKFAVNNEIRSIFPHDTIQISKPAKIYDELFYGKPARVLYPDKYIDLPTLEDCFYELAFNVKITKIKDEKYFRVIGSSSELSVYDPLVLVDMVAITDYKKVLALSPKTISHVDVINTPYVKGHMTYGGIVSIFTKDADYGGINLPETGIFLNYQFLSNNSNNNTKIDTCANKPDARNNLFWEPNLSLDSNKSAIVSFYTSDSKGKFIVLIRANKENGEIISQMHSFEVK